jgi:hypothetical protein
VGLRLFVRIKNQLRQTFSVPQIDKNQIPVVAIGMYPPPQRNLLARVFQPQMAARMCSFEHRKSPSKSVPLAANPKEVAADTQPTKQLP